MSAGSGAKATTESPNRAKTAAKTGSMDRRSKRAAAQPSRSVVRESVTSSPGIKTIERKSLAPNKGVRRRSGKDKEAAQAKTGSKRGALVFVVVVAVLAAAGAAAYFGGLLDSVLGK